LKKMFGDNPSWERASLGWHVRAWGNWVLREARRELSARYPTYSEWQTMNGTAPDEIKPLRLMPTNIDAEEAVAGMNLGISAADQRNPKTPRWVMKPTVAYLWARTVACKSCRATIPLLKTRWLCRAEKRRVILEMTPNAARDGVDFSVSGDLAEPSGNAAQRKAAYRALGAGTMSRTGVTCPCCNGVMKMGDLRYEGQAGRLGSIMTAIAVDGPTGKEFRRPTDYELQVAKVTEAEVDAAFADIPFGVPRDPLPPKEAPGIRLPLYGFEVWSDLFSKRQLLALAVIVRLIRTL
jgi:adenine-specific DNA methylase